jgi:hypothetical protein
MNPLLVLLFRLLEILFLLGIAGSLVVIAVTTVEDFALLFQKDEPALGTTPVETQQAPGPFVAEN